MTSHVKKSTLGIMSAALALAAALPAEASGRWLDSGCWHSSVTGYTGTASSTEKAKQRARGNWEASVRRLGLHKQRADAHKWNYAGTKKYACRRKRGVSRCNAKAVPCGIREVGG